MRGLEDILIYLGAAMNKNDYRLCLKRVE